MLILSSGYIRFVSAAVSFSAGIFSIGFGGGVVAIVQPIHAPIANIAVKVMVTGMAIIQKCTWVFVSKFKNEAIKGS